MFTDNDEECRKFLIKHNTSQFNDITDTVVFRLIQEVLAYRPDYGSVIERCLEGIESIRELKEVLKECIFKSECIMQAFTFSYEIKNHLYIGDHIPNNKNISEILNHALIEDNLFDVLVKIIEDILEEKYFYDYWDIGKDEFSLFFGIHRSVYLEKIKSLRKWADSYDGMIKIPEPYSFKNNKEYINHLL